MELCPHALGYHSQWILDCVAPPPYWPPVPATESDESITIEPSDVS